MAQLTVITRETIDVPDDELIWHEQPDGTRRWLQDVETAKAAMGDLGDREISSAQLLVAAEVRPDPDMQADWDECEADIVRLIEERRVKLLAGVHPDELPTEEQIRADNEAETPDPALVCTWCGSTEFRYDEEVGSSRSMSSFDDGILKFHSEDRHDEGNGLPGVVCDGCEGEVVLPDDVEIDWVS